MSIAAISGGMGLAGGVLQAMGSAEAGYAASNAAMYQAAVAKNNQQIALQNAEEAAQAGVAQASIVSLKGAERLGQVRAGQAASGVDVNSGSAVDVRSSQRAAGFLDAETALHNAELQVYGYRSKAVGFEAEAGLDTMKAEQAKESGEIGALTGLIGSASSVGFKFGGSSSSTAAPTGPDSGSG